MYLPAEHAFSTAHEWLGTFWAGTQTNEVSATVSHRRSKTTALAVRFLLAPLVQELQLKPGCVATTRASALLHAADPSVMCRGIVPASLFASEVCFIICCQLTALDSDAHPSRYGVGTFLEAKNRTSERRQGQFSFLNNEKPQI